MGGIERWRERLGPMFGEPPPGMWEAEKVYGWPLAFQTLPTPEAALRGRFESRRATRLRERAVEGMRVLLRRGWIDERAAAQMIALRPPVVKEDALVAGWTIGGRRIQYVVARQAFVRTTRDQSCGDDSPWERLAAAVALANELFSFPVDPCAAPWQLRTYGSIVVGSMVEPLYPLWYQSLRVVTDGSFVKYTFGPASPPQGSSFGLRRPETPWFEEP